MTNYLHSLERNVHSFITQYPLGKVYPEFHVTVLAIIPLVGAYLYYREYKNPPINPNKIDPSFLPDPRKKAIKFGEKVVSLVEKKQEMAISFLPKRPPEEKTKITPDIVTAVKEYADLNKRISEALKLAFKNKFVEAKESLETFTKDLPSPSAEIIKEISRVIEREKNFIDQLEMISLWSPLEPFDAGKVNKGFANPAYKSWKKAMQAPVEERNANMVSFFSLVEIGLSKGWFNPTSKERYEALLDEMIPEVNQRLEKTWMCHLMHRAYAALGLFNKISIYQNNIEMPPNVKPDEALSYLCRLVKYFHGLGNHEQSLDATFENLFLILKTKPIDIDECSNIFTLVLSCFTTQQLEAMQWALGEMKKSILENREEAPQKKIQLLLVIQNDYKALGNLGSADETLDCVIELINAMPEDEKKPWVEKTALVLNEMQLYEKANLMITKHNALFEDRADHIPLIQSVSLGVLALSTVFVRPFYPLCACVIVSLAPKLLPNWHHT
jgi:tetratricopeptide (TPR) repeat protein